MLKICCLRSNPTAAFTHCRCWVLARRRNALADRCVLPLPALLLTGLAAKARSSTPGAPAALASNQLKFTGLLHAAAARVAAPEADRQLQADGITILLQIPCQLLSLLALERLLQLLLLLLRTMLAVLLLLLMVQGHLCAAAASCAAAISCCRTFLLLLCSMLAVIVLLLMVCNHLRAAAAAAATSVSAGGLMLHTPLWRCWLCSVQLQLLLH
jgi:hypothetical protein